MTFPALDDVAQLVGRPSVHRMAAGSIPSARVAGSNPSRGACGGQLMDDSSPVFPSADLGETQW